jgi:hypothetical protein
MERLLDEFAIHSGGRCLVNSVKNALVRCFARQTSFSWESSAMSQWESFDPARLVLDLPACPKCGARMWLARIEPDAPGHDKRTFECPQCEDVVSETFKFR